jgi:threonine/homoserine/homoserine lactone efflux protein
VLPLDEVYAAGIGAVLGAATGIPLGVVNVAIVEAAARHGRRHATGIGLGGALADGIHAGLAFAGISELLVRHHGLERGLAIGSAVVVLAYAVVVWRRRVPSSHGARARATEGSAARGVGVGLALTLPNPFALLAWVAAAGAVLPSASRSVAVCGAVGVAVGSAVWFAVLARLASRGALDAATRWVPRAAAVVLAAFAAFTVVRALL